MSATEQQSVSQSHLQKQDLSQLVSTEEYHFQNFNGVSTFGSFN